MAALMEILQCLIAITMGMAFCSLLLDIMPHLFKNAMRICRGLVFLDRRTVAGSFRQQGRRREDFGACSN